jgi:hypothetical protein
MMDIVMLFLLFCDVHLATLHAQYLVSIDLASNSSNANEGNDSDDYD